MKRIFLFTVCTVFTLLAEAQIGLAVTGGPQSAGIEEKNNLPGWSENIQPGYSKRSSFHLGFLADIPFNKNWSLQPALLYSEKGRKFSMFYPEEQYLITDTLFRGGSFHTNYIEVPLNFARRFYLGEKTSFFISAGPYLGFFYNGKNTNESRLYFSNLYKSEEENIEVGSERNMATTVDYGVNVRAGIDFNSFFISGFYSHGLKDFYQAAYDGNFYHRVTGASVGIWLNKRTVPVKDKDGDGIPDDRDICPDAAGPEITGGCPDRDSDGIADKDDKCPDVPGLLKYNGCPVPDTDGDGINDEEDECPTVVGPAKYKGCPVPDSDGDGIHDEEDACPMIPGVARYKGCPVPDTDGDGVNDEEDECPNVPGPASNKGCPVIKEEVRKQVELASDKIFFKTNSAEILSSTYPKLDEVVEILKEYPELKLEINGHTDNTGRAEYNKALSQQRAEAVRDYLVKKGIAPSRLKATGYGDERPIVDNNTEENRARNRRVELILRHNLSE
jgi:OOP family OmpA-OmpF porin